MSNPNGERRPAIGAFEKNMEEQLNAALILSEAPGIKILLVGIASAKVDEEQQEVRLCGACSTGTTRRDALAFIAALEREIAMIKSRLPE